jgi:hypothetical protein
MTPADRPASLMMPNVCSSTGRSVVKPAARRVETGHEGRHQGARVSRAQLDKTLDEGERTALHGSPVRAAELLTAAVEAAAEGGDQAATVRARWLLGVAEQGAGRCAAALRVLHEAWPEAKATPLAVNLASSLAEAYRQLGEHATARTWDQRALEEAEGEAIVWPLLGLAADAVGTGDAGEAGRRLAAAEPLAAAGDWQAEVRTGWVAAELAMLEERPADAAGAAATAVARAERAGAAPAVAKGLLFQGGALAQAGEPEASATLARAAGLAELLGALPVAWPARALLGALAARSGRAAEAATELAAARACLDAIAAGLDEDTLPAWLAQPAVAALLQTAAPRAG